MIRQQRWVLALAILLSLSSATQSQTPKAEPRLPEGTKAHRDLAYVKDGHERNKLDLYLPEKADGPLPLIVWVHGGGWLAGSKDGGARRAGVHRARIPQDKNFDAISPRQGYHRTRTSTRFRHAPVQPRPSGIVLVRSPSRVPKGAELASPKSGYGKPALCHCRDAQP